MSATITIIGVEARFKDGAWSSKDAGLAEALNRATPSVVADVPASDPDPENSVAKAIAELFGGELTHADPPAGEYDESLEY